MAARVLLTAKYAAAHPELAGRRCYSVRSRDGSEHRLDIGRAQPHGINPGRAEGYCGTYVDRLVLPGDETGRRECQACRAREERRGRAEAGVAA